MPSDRSFDDRLVLVRNAHCTPFWAGQCTHWRSREGLTGLSCTPSPPLPPLQMCNTHVEHDTRSVDQGFVLRGHKAPVVAVACDEEKVVSASEDGRVIVWDAVKVGPLTLTPGVLTPGVYRLRTAGSSSGMASRWVH